MKAHHVMVCNKVAKMTQVCPDNPADSSRLIVYACSCQPTAEARCRGPGR